MKSGIELITQERIEQIEKHGCGSNVWKEKKSEDGALMVHVLTKEEMDQDFFNQ